MKTKRYFWQPELSISIIYWSLTFIVLFDSDLRENTALFTG